MEYIKIIYKTLEENNSWKLLMLFKTDVEVYKHASKSVKTFTLQAHC